MECDQGHFIQWVSESKRIEQISAAHKVTVDLPKVWQAMLVHLQPGATQAMIRQ